MTKIFVFCFFITVFSNVFADSEPIANMPLGCNDLTMLYTAYNEKLSEEDARTLQETAWHYCGQSADKIRLGMTLIYSNNQIAVDMLGVDGATWYLPNGKAVDLDIAGLLYSARKVAPIEAPFKKYHAQCSGGCSYISWGIWGDEAHKKKASCHNSGGAIDIHALMCGKTKSSVKTAKFQNYLTCMRKHFGVIYGNAAHKNHAHIQLKNCKKIKLK